MSQQSFLATNGTGGNITFSIDSFSEDEIKVYVDGVLKTTGSSNDYTIPNYTNTGGTVTWVGTAPTSSNKIRIVRQTDVLNNGNTAVEGRATFQAGSSVKAVDLNNNTKQALRAIQEQQDQLIQTYDIQDDAVKTAKIADSAVTENQIADNAVRTAKIEDGAVTSAKIADATINTQDLATGLITTSKIADNQVTTAKIADSNITTAKLADANVTTAKIANDAITSDKIANDALTGSNMASGTITTVKIADSNITTDKLDNAGVTTVKIADSAVTADKIATDAVTSVKIQANAVTDGKISASAVTSNKIANGAVTTAKIADDAINSDKIADGAINAAAMLSDNLVQEAKIQDSAIATDKIANSAVTTTKIADNAITTAKIANDALTGSNMASGTITSVKLADNAVTTAKINDNAIEFDKFHADIVVTNSEQASHSVNDTTFFTTAAAEARYFNASTGETIKDGQSFPDNDTTIATTAAINDRIIDLVDDVGGFVAIANETSFPNTNPDVNNGAGTIVSVAAASTSLNPSGTTLTIANGTVGNSTVTITGNATTIPSGFGFLVETTSTLNTYTFHRLVPKATEVTTVAGKAEEIGRLGTATAVEDMSILGTTAVVADMAILATADVVNDLNTLGTADVVNDMNILGTAAVVNDMDILGTSANVTAMSNCSGSISSINNASSNLNSINNFGDTYQVASSAPSTDGGGNALAAGDLYFDTSANELRVYNGSTFQGGVTATGNLAGLGANTFTGNQIIQNATPSIDLIDTNNDSDYQIKNGNGSFNIKDTTNNVNRLTIQSDGQVNIGSMQFYTSNNVAMPVDGAEFKLGAGDDLKLYHDGSHSYVADYGPGALRVRSDLVQITDIAGGGGGDSMATFTSGGAARLYYDGALKAETRSDGFEIKQHLTMGDSDEIRLGNSADLKMYHDGSDSIISDVGSGSLLISSNGSAVEINKGTSEYMARFVTDGVVQLYYDNSKKLETSANGVDIQSGSPNLQVLATTDGENALLTLIGRTSAGGVGTAAICRIEAESKQSSNSASAMHLKTRTTGNVITTAITIDENQHINFPIDGQKLKLGAGQDLQIYHDGSNSFIDSNLAGSQILIRTKESGGTINNVAKFMPDGAVELYYDGVKKFETTSTGISVAGNGVFTGNVQINDSAFLNVGNSGDLQIYHSGSHSFIKNTTGTLQLENAGNITITKGGSENMARFIPDGAVELYYDNSKKLETDTSGVSISGRVHANGVNNIGYSAGDNVKSTYGNSDDLQIYHDGTNSFLVNGASGGILYLQTYGENSLKAHPNGQVELFYDASKKFETTSGGVSVTGNVDSDGIRLGDNDEIRLGAGDDLKIYHSGSHSFIKDSGTGNLQIWTNQLSLLNSGGTESMIQAVENGQVELYYDNVKKAETYASGLIAHHHLKVMGAQDQNAVIQMFADEGDNTNDQYLMVSEHNPNRWVLLGQYDNGWHRYIQILPQQGVQLYYDDMDASSPGAKLITTSYGVGIGGDVNLLDNGTIFGGDDTANSLKLQSTSGNSNHSRVDVGVSEGSDNGGIHFYTAGSSAATRAMTIKGTTQKIGIGTTDPSTKLHLQDSNDLGIRLTKTSASDAEIKNTDSLDLCCSSGGAGGQVVRILTGAAPGTLSPQMGVYGTKILMGMTSTSITSPNNPRLQVQDQLGIMAPNNNDSQTAIVFQNPSGRQGFINTNSSSISVHGTSDYRVKQDINYSIDATSIIKEIKPCTFKFKADTSKTVHGFIAHELQEVVPEAVAGEKDEVVTQAKIDAGEYAQEALGDEVHQGVDPSKLIPLLTKALQEAIAKIETLETKVAALEAA